MRFSLLFLLVHALWIWEDVRSAPDFWASPHTTQFTDLGSHHHSSRNISPWDPVHQPSRSGSPEPHIPSPLATTHLLCPYRFTCLGHFVEMESYNMWPFQRTDFGFCWLLFFYYLLWLCSFLLLALGLALFLVSEFAFHVIIGVVILNLPLCYLFVLFIISSPLQPSFWQSIV